MSSSDEQVVAKLRPHARALFWPTVLLLAVVGALGFLSSTFREPWQNTLMLSIAGVVALVGWLAPLLRWASRSYTVTTQRVVVTTGIVVRSRREVRHAQVEHVTLHRSPLQLIAGSGDIELETSSGRSVELRDVPAAALVQEALHDLAEDAPAQSGF